MNAVISLTTIPSRIEYIEPCIDSLMAQGLPVYLWVAERVERTGTVLNEIPDFLWYERTNLTVTVVGDQGPITKLLPALEAGFKTIITADDDMVYGEGWASGLLAWSKQLPRAAICYRGRCFTRSRLYSESKVITKQFRYVDLITGVRGALYRSSFFDDSIFREWEQWPLNDDIVISAHLKQQGIAMAAVPYPRGCTTVALDQVMKIDSLNGVNVKGKLNDEGLAKMFWTKGEQ